MYRIVRGVYSISERQYMLVSKVIEHYGISQTFSWS